MWNTLPCTCPVPFAPWIVHESLIMCLVGLAVFIHKYALLKSSIPHFHQLNDKTNTDYNFPHCCVTKHRILGTHDNSVATYWMSRCSTLMNEHSQARLIRLTSIAPILEAPLKSYPRLSHSWCCVHWIAAMSSPFLRWLLPPCCPLLL